ncbi:MAG: ribosome maturation factor RimP [Coriobacteriales bacterium]|nr:ribosome maturation factor RimP [Coriobacteriales bacterium]
MAQTPLELQLISALEERAANHAIDVVDVEVVGSMKAPVVRVRIDHADESLPTISLDEITAQNDWISEVLDELDPIPGSYSLEVSSPGLARPLRKERDFARFAGETISLSTTATEGRRKYTGELLGIVDGVVTVRTDEGEFSFALSDIKTAKIKPDYDKLAKAAQSAQKE